MRPGCEFFAGSESPRGSVNHSRPSGPKARSLGPSRRTPATSVATTSTAPSVVTRWMPGVVRPPLPIPPFCVT